MSFTPLIPTSGLAGWAFLTRTKERQEASFAATPAIDRAARYFQDKIAGIDTADGLVSDRRLLRVALGAFGLQDDLDNRAFIRKVIEEGTSDRGALANRLSDKRYLAFATAFAHLSPTSDTTRPPDLADRMVTQFKTRAFEVAVGEQDETMRLAMTLQRDMPGLVSQFGSDSARWYGLLGNPPLRKILETSLGLPKEFGALDVDEQVKRMRGAMQKRFGASEIEKLATPQMLEKLTRRFLVMSQLRDSQTAMTGAATALMLLQNIRR